MEKEEVIEKSVAFVKENLNNTDSGHDWWHVYRVLKLARHIAAHEKDADLFIVELGVLFHDIADYKFHGGDKKVGPKRTREFLSSLSLDEKIIAKVEDIVKKASYSDTIGFQGQKSKELQIVQDADRLDAMGAMGIARAFIYGGHKKRPIYNPSINPKLNMTSEEYRKADSPTINHFYEKLLLLKDRMNTSAARKMAENRHRFMEKYLGEFYDEWEGKT